MKVNTSLKSQNWCSKKIKIVFIPLVLLIGSDRSFGQEIGTEKRIVIDPGHGGIDSGAIGVNGTYEKDVALKVAKEILNLNRSFFENELDIYLTRYTDTLISLSDRSRLAKSLNADVFVSLHCNASQNASRGMEVYVHSSDSPNSKASISLGVSVLDESTGKLGLKKRGIGFANFQVLRGIVGYCPSILVEMGFMTNPDEADYFLESKSIRALAMAILMGIVNHLNTEREKFE
ncbi:N-acetylmuramoyl-L-alanine amidase [Muricauda sp. SCSIO 64092]|uniref:N-acetylmuramoyl-L-alanine amidase family protein n=1 Tax=Allomuricauda sp. SCSIO 64092 TaxID=2908842 RepID=UPI001FF6CD7F|nr:N-acetylmuramoyl-L-alanine amidase [Muricauda sp. SCSIO 64092]UOY05749.1 N-acetylmuramoyl-L-alanine amidase [Muricauda sp. SCSIO 64092]